MAYRSDPAENGQYRVKLKVRQEHVGEEFQMYVPVRFNDLDGVLAEVKMVDWGE